MKIYTSFWSKGNLNRMDINSLERINFFFSSYLEILRIKNSHFEFVLITDDECVAKMSPKVLNSFDEVIVTLDQYNFLEPHQWSLVKMKAISSITDDEILHLDYDILWDYDIDYFLNYLRNNNIDVLHQNYERIGIKEFDYRVFIDNNPDFVKNNLKKTNPKMAYNCGIIYLNNKAKKVYQYITNNTQLNDFGFGTWLGFEQLYTPVIMKETLNVSILADIVKNLNKIDYVDLFGLEKIEEINNVSTMSIYLPKISYFHFMGRLKNSSYIEDIKNRLLSKNNTNI